MMGNDGQAAGAADDTRHNRLASAFAAVAAAGYYGFLFAGAFAPSALAGPAIGHVPWSFVMGASVIGGAIGLTGLYALVANAREAGERRRTGPAA